MRTVTMVVRGAMAALLVAVVAAGCAAQETSSPERTEIPGQPAAATRAPEPEGLAPGDQRAPETATVTTRRQLPIGRPSRPAVTTTSTAPRPTTTTTTLAPVGP